MAGINIKHRMRGNITLPEFTVIFGNDNIPEKSIKGQRLIETFTGWDKYSEIWRKKWSDLVLLGRGPEF